MLQKHTTQQWGHALPEGPCWSSTAASCAFLMELRLLLFCMKIMERRRVREPEPSALIRLSWLLFRGSRAAVEPLGEREGAVSKLPGNMEGPFSKPLGDMEGAFSKESVCSGLSLHHVYVCMRIICFQAGAMSES